MEINTNRQNQALVILTIGTAVLGVGLFQVDFLSAMPFSTYGHTSASMGHFQ